VEVPVWQARAAGLIARFPSLFFRLGRIESSYFAEQLPSGAIDRPIFIAGLARAGSTILLSTLAEHPDLATHRYRDFPFLATPIWWNAFLDRARAGKTAEPAERAHKDRILVSPESPEAMEEPLWMAFFPDLHDPNRDNVLSEETQHPAFEAVLVEHIRKILHIRKGRRYLSKGNYNSTRLAYLHRLFPDARFLIPFRDPVHQIASLMKQHRLFTEAARDNSHVDRYLRRVGHFEFGPARIPVRIGTTETVAAVQAAWDQGDEVRGWALAWADLYGHLLEVLERRPTLRVAALPIDYDALCQAPHAWLETIYSHCDLKISGDSLDAQAATLSAPDYYRVGFDDAAESLIRDVTAPVYARLKRLVPTLGGLNATVGPPSTPLDI